MKIKQFQQFKTLDVISVFALLGVVLAVVGHVFWSNMGDKKHAFAKKDMESLSGQLLAGGLNSLPSAKNERSIASVPSLQIEKMGSEGKIGKDPWGEAFHYKVLHSKQKSYVVVISGGPDRQMQTDYTTIDIGPSGHVLGAKFLSDDVGYVRKVHK